jgi:hypothetical protein
MSLIHAPLEDPRDPGDTTGVVAGETGHNVQERADSLLEAAQGLRRSISGVPTLSTTVAVLGSLEATLDSLGVSLAELRGPLLTEASRSLLQVQASNSQRLDMARLLGEAGAHLSEGAAACGDLRAILDARAVRRQPS